MIGFGYDSHRLVSGRDLFLGGIKIDSQLGCEAHSDGDALLHAVCDAIIGAMCMGDIGEHFPDTDPQYKDISSSVLLTRVVELMEDNGYHVVNIDASVILQAPKLAPYKQAIKEHIASICKVEPGRVNIKAKTNEKMGFTGRGEGVVAMVVCQLGKN